MKWSSQGARTTPIGVEANTTAQEPCVQVKTSVSQNTNGLAVFARREGVSVLRWWPRVKTIIDMRMKPFTAIFIGEDIGMVALRLARKFKLSTILVRRSTELGPLTKLASSIGVNNIITARDTVADCPFHGPESAQGDFMYVFLAASTVIKYLDNCSLWIWERRIGHSVAHASDVALLELPRLVLIQRILEIGFGVCGCAKGLHESYSDDELNLVKSALSSAREMRIVTIEILLPRKYVLVNSTGPSSIQLPAEDPLLFRLSFNEGALHEERSQNFDFAGSLTLSAVRSSGVTSNWLRWLLRAHLELPLWKIKVSMVQADSVDHVLSASKLRIGPVQINHVSSAGDCEDMHTKPEVVQHMMTSPPLTLKVPSLSNLGLTCVQGMTSTWPALRSFLVETPAEHRNGRFSLYEWGGANRSVAISVAELFPNATVVSVAGLDLAAALDIHAGSAKQGNIIACGGVPLDVKLAFHMYESPELSRYSLLAFAQDHLPKYGASSSLAAAVYDDTGLDDVRRTVGALVSSSLTSFIPMPSGSHASLALDTVFGSEHSRTLIDQSVMSMEVSFEAKFLEQVALRPSVAGGSTWIALRGSPLVMEDTLFPPPLTRVDVLSLTRPVHHHFDWSRDGHKRTYTMHVDINDSVTLNGTHSVRGSRYVESLAIENPSGGGEIMLNTLDRTRLELPRGHHVSSDDVVHVRIVRDEDGSYIPYGKIQSITLIAAIRLGLVAPQRKQAFSAFVKLPLYEDMAPWNIAFKGSGLEYIDYDTRHETYDLDVHKVYRVLSVLMNYKRTVQDFGMCGPKAKTVYGFSYVGDCVRPTSFVGACESSSRFPVPCDDGQCHSDFISCLRSIASAKESWTSWYVTSKARSFEDSIGTRLVDQLPSFQVRGSSI